MARPGSRQAIFASERRARRSSTQPRPVTAPAATLSQTALFGQIQRTLESIVVRNRGPEARPAARATTTRLGQRIDARVAERQERRQQRRREAYYRYYGRWPD